MGCGTSTNDQQVKLPHSFISINNVPSNIDENDENHGEEKHQNNVNFQNINTQKSIIGSDGDKGKCGISGIYKEQETEFKGSTARIYLFGESKQQRKIIKFQAAPNPHFQILLSRTNNPPPVKYQPSDVILQESQELAASSMYISTSHPPYNYMLAVFIKQSIIFLCGGVNYNFDNVSNQAFYYYTKSDNLSSINTPQKVSNKKRKVGYNLMGSKFQKLALMKTKRYSHMGVFYKAGKLGYIYVLGGRSQNDETMPKCQKYSISQNKWTQIAPLNLPRSTGFSLIINKKIYVFGGYTKDAKRSKKIERYNPLYDNWQILNIKLHKGIQTGLILPCHQTNQILLVGGNVQCGAIKSVIRVNFQFQTYIWDSDLKNQRLLQKGIALLEENTAYVFGGDFEDTVEKYSYKDKTWKFANNLLYGQCVSPDDINAFSIAQQTIQLHYQDPSTLQRKQQNIAQNQNPLLSSQQYIYIFGNDEYPCIYELNTTKWLLKKRNVPMNLRLRSLMTCTKIKQGKIFIGGGIDNYYQKASRAAYIYYPGTNKTIQIDKMKDKKYGFAACAVQQFLYVFGGQTGKQGNILAGAEKYDFIHNKWIDLPDMPRQRTMLKVIIVPNTNNIVLVGGTDSLYQGVSQIDIFDINTDTFTTLQVHFPLVSQIKYINIVDGNKKAKKKQFQFLDNCNQKCNKYHDHNSNCLELNKLQNNQQEKKISEFEQAMKNVIVFGYNSYKKQDIATSISLISQQNKQKKQSTKQYKLYPYSLIFPITNPQVITKQINSNINEENQEKINNSNQIYYYFISNKGVFKWQVFTQEIHTQIVINQIHLLQMPLQKFCIA